MIFEILLSLFYIALFSLIILKAGFFNIPFIKKRMVLAAFYLKILAGILMYFIYSNYYTDRSKADIFKYFDDSEVMFNALADNPGDYVKMLLSIDNDNPYFDKQYYRNMNNWYRTYETATYNDSHTIIRLNAFLRLFSFGYYQVHGIIMALLSFIGLIALYRVFHSYMKSQPIELFFCLFLIPSVLFWGSGVLKEGLLIFGLGLLLYGFQKSIFQHFCIWNLLLLLLSLLVLIYTKFYVLAALAPVLLANLWIIFTNNRFVLPKYFIMILLFIDVAVILPLFGSEFDMFSLLVAKQHDFIGLSLSENAGSFISPLSIEPNLASFILNTPMALINSIFRPFINDISSPLILLSFIENLFLYFLIILVIIFPKRSNLNWRIILFCLFFVLLLFSLTGLITPVLGALVRYRVPGLPFLYIALFMVLDKKKLLDKFPSLNKLLPGNDA